MKQADPLMDSEHTVKLKLYMNMSFPIIIVFVHQKSVIINGGFTLGFWFKVIFRKIDNSYE